MKKLQAYRLEALLPMLTIGITAVMGTLAAQMYRQYGGVDPMFLLASGMLIVAPLLLKENW
jgi:hypothetical protein